MSGHEAWVDGSHLLFIMCDRSVLQDTTSTTMTTTTTMIYVITNPYIDSFLLKIVRYPVHTFFLCL